MEALPLLGNSGIANMLGAIKAARYYSMGEDDCVMTVATDRPRLVASPTAGARLGHLTCSPDSAKMYASGLEDVASKRFVNGKLETFDMINAAEAYGQAHTPTLPLPLLHTNHRRAFWVPQPRIS